MRLKGNKVDINYERTKTFFSERSKKYNEQNPYGTTMYQDKNAELVRQRNEYEVKTILPLLELDNNSIVLDIACGVGRWADSLKGIIKLYYGVDFSEEFIAICNNRIKNDNFIFKTASTAEIKNCFHTNRWGKCNRIILAGILMYLNDNDIENLFNDLKDICMPDSLIYVREPIGIEERLTLKEHFSDELETQYNAIYRTRQDYMDVFEHYNIKVLRENFLFDSCLNNRKETAQYYFILKV